MEVQRVTADEKIAADRGKVALRYGPLLYNVETADNKDITKAISNQPLTLKWNNDFLHGVMTINGTWSDGSPLLAIPNYTRLNRVPTTETPESENPKYVEGAPVSTVWMNKNE
jgi:hypothetical protein